MGDHLETVLYHTVDINLKFYKGFGHFVYKLQASFRQTKITLSCWRLRYEGKELGNEAESARVPIFIIKSVVNRSCSKE